MPFKLRKSNHLYISGDGEGSVVIHEVDDDKIINTLTISISQLRTICECYESLEDEALHGPAPSKKRN
jgi:hypothetical protein